MKLLGVVVAVLLTAQMMTAVDKVAPKLFIEPQEGFESYLSAAMVKKQVPLTMIANKDEADFVLTSNIQEHKETTGSKITRCLFLYCAGIEDKASASVQLLNAKTQEVVWAYNVNKGRGQKNYQSTAEAIAKHLKDFIAEHREKFAVAK